MRNPNLHLYLEPDLRRELERVAADRRAGFASTTVDVIRAGVLALTAPGHPNDNR